MSTFFADLSNTLGADLGANLLNRTGDFISQLTPLFAAAFAIYVLLVIWDYYSQSFDVAFIDFVKKCMGWVVIISLAFSPAMYMKLAHLIYGLPDEIAAIFAGGYSVNASAMDASWSMVRELLVRISEIHNEYSWMEIGVHLGLEIKIALVITICAALIIGLSFAFYMVAKISLALVLMIGVFFMGCLLFPSTRQYGMNWIGQCLNHIITCTMFVLLTKVQMAVFDKTVNTALNGGVLDYVAVEMLPPVFLLQTIIFVIIVFNIASIASALTGGAAVQGASRHLMSLARAGGFAGSTAGKIGGAFMKAASNRSSGGSLRTKLP